MPLNWTRVGHKKVSISSLDMICPRYVIQDLKNSHLLGLRHNPAVDNFSNTPLRIHSSGVFENMMISSK